LIDATSGHWIGTAQLAFAAQAPTDRLVAIR
jgi:hypothetical protein